MSDLKFSFAAAEKQLPKSVTLVQLVDQEATSLLRQPQERDRLLLGCKDFTKTSLHQAHLLMRRMIATAKAQHLATIAVLWSDLRVIMRRLPDAERAELFATNAELANYIFTAYKTAPKDGWPMVREIWLVGAPAAARKGVERGQLIGQGTNLARELSNTPSGDMTPQHLAKEAQQALRGLPVKVQVLGKAEIEKLRMGALLAVAKGYRLPPQFIIMEYRGAAAKQRPVVLVGKGITYDSGGLSLKPGDYLLDMHMDMSGGAAVVAVVRLAAQLKLKKNIIGLVPVSENMISSDSYRPTDVVQMMSGKKVEILNTDAEGRMVLADAITYAKRFQPKTAVIVATLTGSAMVTFGQRCAAFFASQTQLENVLRRAGEASGDYAWPLPLWDEYGTDLKSAFADIVNTTKSRFGGAIEGAMFLKEFAQELNCPWAHLDIASRMTTIEEDCMQKGSAGAGVRLLVRALQQL